MRKSEAISPLGTNRNTEPKQHHKGSQIFEIIGFALMNLLTWLAVYEVATLIINAL